MHNLLEIRTLGGLAITCGPVTGLATRKAEAVLVYLASRDHPQPRETLAELFWPDRPQSQALASMRVTLNRLRQHLGPYITATRQTIGLNPDSPYWFDVAELEDQLALAGNDANVNARILARAVEMYHGDFLAGFFVHGCPEFETWVRTERDRLQRTIIERLRILVRHDLEHGASFDGITHAAQLLQIDPLHEETHRHLMLLLAQTGQRAEALRQFEICHDALAEEFGIEPDAETTALYHAIRDGSPITARPAAPARHNLPAQLTPFVGREAELVQLAGLVNRARLITLVGPGGIGKTRLALECAAQQVGRFSHGVFFVALVGLQSPDHIVPAVAEAVGCQFQSNERSPRQQLLDFLRRKHVLLVLDNFEHLLDGAALVTDVLQSAPDVTVLATSRERLDLSGETVVPLGGLELPDTDDSGDPMSYSAIRLFMQSAWQNRPDFDAAADHLQYAARICRLVDGVPLGVLLAASWIEMLSLRDIAEEIDHGLGFLATDRRDLPDRHRSLHAVFESSWQHLPDNERAALMRLSVFRGRFSRQAALQITGASLHTLKRLLDKSLLRRDPVTGRYDVHELVRQFAADRLVLSGDADHIREVHSRYYADFLHQRTGDVKGGRQRAALDEIDTDFDNIRAAWLWAVEHRRAPLIERSLECLGLFCGMRCRWKEGQQLVQAAAEAFATCAPRLSARLQLRAIEAPGQLADVEHLYTLAQQAGDAFEAAHCLRLIGTFRGDVACMEEALAQFESLGDRYYSAVILRQLGFLYGNAGAPEASLRCLRRCDTIAREQGNHITLGGATLLLGSIELWREGNYPEAIRRFSEAQKIQVDMRNRQGIGVNEALLGRISFLMGDFEGARTRADAAWQIAQEIGDMETKAFVLHIRSLLASMAGRYHDAIQDADAAFTAAPGHPITNILGNLALAIAHCELADLETAHMRLQTGLGCAARSLFTAAQTWFLPVGALLRRDQPEIAAEMLSLALHHPQSATGWVQRWHSIDHLRDDLQRSLSPDQFSAAWTRGHTCDLQLVVGQLVDDQN